MENLKSVSRNCRRRNGKIIVRKSDESDRIARRIPLRYNDTMSDEPLQPEKKPLTPGEGLGVFSLVFGVLTLGTFLIWVSRVIFIWGIHAVICCVIFSVLGIAIGRHALKTDEWLVALIGMFMCISFYGAFIVLVISHN
jgi:hypothetical protein